MLGALRSAWAACKICLKTNCNRIEGVGSVVEPLSRSPQGGRGDMAGDTAPV